MINTCACKGCVCGASYRKRFIVLYTTDCAGSVNNLGALLVTRMWSVAFTGNGTQSSFMFMLYEELSTLVYIYSASWL